MKHNRPTVADLSAYDEIIDVRTPAEFAEDHIPGAINCPVLDNEERIEHCTSGCPVELPLTDE